jgi:hypothetical protein
MNAHPEVMRYYPSTAFRDESDGFIDWASGLIAERGWGLWAVEVVEGPSFIGVVGLNEPRDAASEALRFGFEEIGLEEIVAMTVPANERSRRVMERLGMTHDPADDFDRPKPAPGVDAARALSPPGALRECKDLTRVPPAGRRRGSGASVNPVQPPFLGHALQLCHTAVAEGET